MGEVQKMKKEIWLDIPNSEGYMVSNFGNLRTFDRKVRNGKIKKDGTEVVVSVQGRDMKPGVKDNGYLIFCPFQKSKYVHRAVWEAFKGPIPTGMEINHIDGDKTNNALDNLQLCSHKENQGHALRTGLLKKCKSSGRFVKETA